MTFTKYCLLTNDVEDHSIWLNKLRSETGKKVLVEGLPQLLDLYEKYKIKSTFFFTGHIVKEYPSLVKMIISNGHEVGSHGYSHNPDNAFDVLSLKEQINHLNKSKKLLEDLSGQEVISFRAPALRVNKNTSIALNHTGFKIDSSIASQRFDFFLSLGGLKKMKWLTAPRLPYRTDINNLFRKGSSEIIEVPISATLLPYIGTTMRIFPGITKIQRKILNTENKLNHKPIVFLIHPNEIIDESNEKHFIMRRSNNLISYLIRDLLRSKMKIKNLGINALVLYEREISYFIKNQYSFSTLKGYCSTNKLI